MRKITKNNPPSSFVQFAARHNVTFLGLRGNTKKQTKLYLMKDQGFVCCYCGRKLNPDGSDSQIEHFLPKTARGIYAHLQLDYNNLLACCDGGKKADPPVVEKFCEAVKNDSVMQFNPLTDDGEMSFIFSEDGEIYGLDPKADEAIEILRLSSSVLKYMRKAAIKKYSYLSNVNWQNEHNSLANFDANGELTEFCFVLRSYIYMYQL